MLSRVNSLTNSENKLFTRNKLEKIKLNVHWRLAPNASQFSLTSMLQRYSRTDCYENRISYKRFFILLSMIMGVLMTA